jgi:hypothetical protein
MADATVSNTVECKLVWVRVPPSAPRWQLDGSRRLSTLEEAPMPKYDESALFRSALAVLLDKAGGKLEYTQTEYAAIRAR